MNPMSRHVASMSRGVSGNDLEALKTNGNFCHSKARCKRWKCLVISIYSIVLP